MIKKFHVLYVGQIALDHVGIDGTPANDRRYASERLSEVFATARDVALTMVELGFHALWTAEHHFQLVENAAPLCGDVPRRCYRVAR